MGNGKRASVEFQADGDCGRVARTGGEGHVGLRVLKVRAEVYCNAKSRAILKPLGDGTDGAVWKTDQHTAVKISVDVANHVRELECYERLKERHVDSINGFSVPQLIGFDNDLLAIEMTIVSPPFLLDFGKASLDKKPDYAIDPHIMEDWNTDQAELWEDDWPTVRRLVYALQRYGIYYYDINKNNIRF